MVKLNTKDIYMDKYMDTDIDELRIFFQEVNDEGSLVNEIDLPKDYIKIRSRTIWYLTGYLRTSGVKDLYYTYIKENHLFKDDYLYISYDKKIEGIKGKYSNDEVRNFDFFICGGDIIKVLYAIEKNSDIDTTEIRNKIKEKFEWWKENEQEDYKRSFGGKKIDDIFEYYEKNIK